MINDQLRSMGPDLVPWLDEVIYSHNFCGNRLLTENVWFNFENVFFLFSIDFATAISWD